MPTTPPDAALREAARTSTAWPFEEARRLALRHEAAPKPEVLFETGYGPSGLPHLGTFAEVARTSMVRRAFETLTGGTVPTRLLAFSDDLDGLRKVPDNVPNGEMLRGFLGHPLTAVPDPFGTHESFGAHNNARLRAFLDAFGFAYEFASSTDYYRSGRFDAALRLVLERYDEVQAIMLPSLREERAASYAPFLPIHPRDGRVMQVPIDEARPASGTLVWRDPDTAERFETPVTGGAAKLQWKPDWAMRWVALGVDYEMAGKDLIDSVKLSGRIARALGATPPEGFNYELFLDAEGRKVSKSKGNGMSVEDWLAYGTPESLALFIYARPREAKRLHFEAVPRAVDDYERFLAAYPGQAAKDRLTNPVWHLHAGEPPAPEAGREGVSFALLLNLATVANAEGPEALWAYLRRYAPDVSAQTHPRLAKLVDRAVRYFQDRVKPAKRYRAPTPEEREALAALSAALEALPTQADAEAIQSAVYDAGRRVPFLTTLKDGREGVARAWFNALYETLLGEPEGPRFGTFAAIYGLPETRALIARALAGELARAAAAE